MNRREMLAAVTAVVGGCSSTDPQLISDFQQIPLLIAVIPDRALSRESIEKFSAGLQILERRLLENTGVKIPVVIFPPGTTVQAISSPPEGPKISGAEFI